MIPSSPVKKTRCAVYTRKSHEEGLEQEFNSLDAQREAGESYIAAQRHEGWGLVPDRYDDGGFTGGNTERPALKHLMADIRNGKIDAVVVYKIDRLTRSLLDFAKLIEVFDAHDHRAGRIEHCPETRRGGTTGKQPIRTKRGRMMTLPERDYFYLPEVCAKLGITPYELQGYLAQGDLVASMWIKRDTFRQQVYQKDHTYTWSFETPMCFGGFVDINPELHHILYAHDKAETRYVYQPYPAKGLFHFGNGTLSVEMTPGGWGTLLGHSVGRLVRENPVDAIGAHANIDTCHLGGMYCGNNNERIFPPDGTIINFEMPPIAENYEQFLAMCEERGKAAIGAIG